MSLENEFDPWTQLQHAADAEKPDFEVATIDGVKPLDEQLGVEVPKTVPDALYAILFEQIDPSDAEIAAARNDLASVPPMGTYAILDAGKIPNLPELLETSGLDHRCLFKGEAYDDLKDVAPWIVRLEDGNTFTRNLFTQSKAPWHLASRDPGIYLRSRGTLNDVWGHFRKFTRVQDENGKWFYLRFFDPQVCCTMIMTCKTPNDDHQIWHALVRPAHIALILAIDSVNHVAQIVKNHQDDAGKKPNAARRLTQQDRAVLSSMRLQRFDRNAMIVFAKEFRDFEQLPRDQRAKWYDAMLKRATRDGINLEHALMNYGRAEILMKCDLREHPITWDYIGDSTLHQKDRARLAFETAKSRAEKRT